ncbi:MAG: hypothetical protein JWP12_9 [Bacteroidetes bacterium]|nr:hypothetical protein [Bacteroidota bacterium]
MKRFLRQLFIFCLLFLLLAWLAHLPDRDKYSGSPYYSKKYTYYKQHSAQYNAVVFGSSRMFRQVNPDVLDSVLGAYHFSTYNLGAPATFNPEEYFLYEQLLEEDHAHLKYAFLELQPLNKISELNVDSKRNYYWMNFKYLRFATQYILRSNDSAALKKQQIDAYCQSYVNNKFDFSGVLTLFKKKENSAATDATKNGFYSLNDEMNDTPGEDEFSFRLNAFLKDTTVLNERRKGSEQAFSKKLIAAEANVCHMNKLKKLIAKSEEAGIHLFFVMPPKLNAADYAALLPIMQQLPEANVIQLADVKTFPQLYLASNSFDIGHLNKKGAAVFSALLANEIAKKLNAAR